MIIANFKIFLSVLLIIFLAFLESQKKKFRSNINECFKLCSLHATTYSTSTFEAALLGIPTILIHSKNTLNFFKTDFSYPLQYTISDYNIASFYQEQSKIVQQWASKFYTSFNEGLIKEQVEFAKLFSTKDTEEGLSAFVEKRSPDFKGE